MRVFEDAREKWFSEKHLYRKFCCELKDEIKKLFNEAKLPVTLEYRIKEDSSLMKKIILQKKDYSEIRDKAGIRMIVNFLSDVDRADKLIVEYFGPRIKKREDNSEFSDENTFGYQSIHYDIIGDVESDNQKFCELQLRTVCQHSWSSLGHILSYKSEISLPRELRREINALSVLFEIADRQFQYIINAIRDLPVQYPSRILSMLDGFFYSQIGAWYDSEISYIFLNGIEKLYDSKNGTNIEYGQNIVQVLEKFLENKGNNIASMAKQKQDIIFFSQPEIVVILERLENRKLALSEYWESRFPKQELKKIATAWGISLD